MKAIILFGHGARNPRWREPFDRLAALWREQHQGVPVELAFLEMMQPALDEAVASLSALGVTRITVVPVFFGQGGHLRNDFPALIENCRKQFSQIQFNTAPAVGESDAVLQAIVDFAKKTLDSIESSQ